MAKLLTDTELIATLIGGLFVVLASLVARPKGGELYRELRLRKMYRLRGKLQHTCPHLFLEWNPRSGVWEAYPLLRGPTADGDSRCQRCNLELHKKDATRRFSSAFEDEITPLPVAGNAIKGLLRQARKAIKLRVKLDKLGNWTSS